ncbi:unnamed protein product [Aphanomyces euteiches]
MGRQLLHWAFEELWDAVEDGLDELVPNDLQAIDSAGNTLFILACCAGEAHIVSLLLARDPQSDQVVNKPNNNGMTGFMYASMEGYTDMTALLLQHATIDVNVTDHDGMSALMLASRHGQAKIVAMLLQDARVNVNLVDKNHCSAFIHACKLGDSDIVETFLEQSNADFNLADKDGWTGFMSACSDGNKDVLTLLRKDSCVDVNAVNHVGMSGFLMVCRNGDFELIRLLLEHAKLHVSQENKDGWTAADFISCKLHCATYQDTRENDKIVDSIGKILRRGGSLKHVMMTVACKGECKGGVLNLSELAHGNKWEDIRNQLRQGYLGDINKTYKGKTLLERCCKEGKLELVALTLHHKGVDVDFLNNKRNSALDVAISRNRVECVKLLLGAGAAIEHDNKSALDKLNEGAKNPRKVLEIRQLVQDEVQKRQEFPLHCLLEYGKLDEFHKALQTVKVPLDRTDQHGKTVLMLAAEGGLVEIVRELLNHKLDIDFQQTDQDTDGFQGKTALAYAALNGHFAVVDVLLSHLTEMEITYLKDIVEYSIFDLVKEQLSSEETTSQYDSSNLTKCLDLLEKEKSYRANSSIYVDKLRSKLQAMADDAPFDEVLFRRSINADPSLGRLFLNDCLHPDRHELGFSKLEVVYGVDDVHTSALYSILHLESDNLEFMNEAKKLLEHVVMQRVLRLKWEFFAQRMFLEQLLIYVVMISSMTISVTMHGELQETESFAHEIAWWAISLVFACLGFVVAQLLRPKPLWCVSRFLHEGNFAFAPGYHIPNLSKVKTRAKWIFSTVVVITTLAVAPVVVLFVLPGVERLLQDEGWGYTLSLKAAINVVLWTTTAYFLILEWKEFRGESGVFSLLPWMAKSTSSSIAASSTSKTPTRKTSWKYFESAVNCWQVLTYLLILFVYVPYQLTHLAAPPHGGLQWYADAILCLGCSLTLFVWILSLQYFAVFRTGGYLLPMMSGILQDVWNFLSIFAVIQLALSCTFYQLLHDKGQVGYDTPWRAFTTTLFVLFGQYEDMWTKPDDDTLKDSAVIRPFAMMLTLFHATLVTVLLLNVLLATMNRTVDRGLDLSKTEALWSYAQCILRMEVTLTDEQREQVIFIDQSGGGQNVGQRHRTVWRLATDSSVGDDTMPLLPTKPERYNSSFRRRAEVVGILNPAFEEKVAKADMPIGDEDAQVIKGLEETIKEWDTSLEELHTTTLGELDKVRASIKHTNHFTKTPMFTDELEHLSRTKRKIMTIFADAIKKRAPEAMDKAKRIQELDKRIQREMYDLKAQFAKSPDSLSSTTFYHIVHGTKLTDALALCDKTIERRFQAVKDKFAREAMQEPTLNDLRNQLRDTNDARMKAMADKFKEHAAKLHKVEEKIHTAVHDQVAKLQHQVQAMKTEMDAQQAKLQAQMDLIVRLLHQINDYSHAPGA